jgi:hypothetical protein
MYGAIWIRCSFSLLLLTVFLTMDLIREREGETGRRRAQTGEGERWGMRRHTRWRRRGGGRPVGGARNRNPAGRAARGRLQTHEVVAPMVMLVVGEAPRRARGTHQDARICSREGTMLRLGQRTMPPWPLSKSTAVCG